MSWWRSLCGAISTGSPSMSSQRSSSGLARAISTNSATCIRFRGCRTATFIGPDPREPTDYHRRSDIDSFGSTHQDVAELPRIGGVDVFREEALAVRKRRPVGVDSVDRAQIGPLHLKAAVE